MRVACPGSVGQLGLEISACDFLYHVAIFPDPHVPSSQAGTSVTVAHRVWKIVPQTVFRVGRMSPPVQLGAPLRGSLSSLRSWSRAYF